MASFEGILGRQFQFPHVRGEPTELKTRTG